MVNDTPVSASDVRRAGMDLLARREHGREELAGKLRRRFTKRDIAPGLIESALDALEADGLLSDERYAESLLRQLLSKGVGPMRLRQELKQRGLSEAARSHIQPDIDAVDWFALAETVYEKKFGERVSPADRDDFRREQMRRMRFMQSRGFISEQFVDLIREGMRSPSDEFPES